MGLFSFFKSKKEKTKLPDTRLYIHDTLAWNTEYIEQVRDHIVDYLKNVSNSDKAKPKIASVTIYAATPFNPAHRVRRNVLVLTNYVNERSRKEEFDNMTLWKFLNGKYGYINRALGGDKSDVPSHFELYHSESLVEMPVDPGWLNEDPAKISLFHNDYAVEKVIPIKGFDTDGEPGIRIMNNGTIIIAFNFMPPCNGEDHGGELGEFENFDKYLEERLGTNVLWEDREFFIIEKPLPDTAEKIKDLLENYWKNKK